MRMRDIAALGRQRHGSVRVESSGLVCKTKGQGQTQRKGSPAAGIAVQGAQGETGAMNNFKGIEERGGRKQRIWRRIAVLHGRRRLASYAGEMAQQHTARCCCCCWLLLLLWRPDLLADWGAWRACQVQNRCLGLGAILKRRLLSPCAPPQPHPPPRARPPPPPRPPRPPRPPPPAHFPPFPPFGTAFSILLRGPRLNPAAKKKRGHILIYFISRFMTPPVSYKAEPCKGYLDTKPIECSNQAFRTDSI